ncbi:MAG: dienelactone hydrolase family protein [Candidatus Dormibacteria bacterium]
MTVRDVVIDSPQGRLRGCLAVPETPGPHPGVVVIHEIYGLNDNIRDITGRLAAEGYASLAVDLFSGRNRALCMARLMGGALIGRSSFAVTDLGASAEFLGAQPEVDGTRVGVVGFCMGGGLALAWGCRDRRLRAIAPFYATNPRPLGAVRRLCPVVGSYPGRDFTARAGRRLATRLSAFGIAHDVKVYPGARHSFFNDRGSAHDPAASADAWERTLAFFAGHVRAGPAPP